VALPVAALELHTEDPACFNSMLLAIDGELDDRDIVGVVG
jgi:hypothetical protein